MLDPSLCFKHKQKIEYYENRPQIEIAKVAVKPTEDDKKYHLMIKLEKIQYF